MSFYISLYPFPTLPQLLQVAVQHGSGVCLLKGRFSLLLKCCLVLSSWWINVGSILIIYHKVQSVSHSKCLETTMAMKWRYTNKDWYCRPVVLNWSCVRTHYHLFNNKLKAIFLIFLSLPNILNEKWGSLNLNWTKRCNGTNRWIHP